jgi:hypothetical protein
MGLCGQAAHLGCLIQKTIFIFMQKQDEPSSALLCDANWIQTYGWRRMKKSDPFVAGAELVNW